VLAARKNKRAFVIA